MAENLFDLSGKTALITGSSKGIGKAIATEMARHGASVVISSRKQDACRKVADEINREFSNSGGRAIAIAANVGHKDELQQLVENTLGQYGKIDILVCNAAVNPYIGPSKDLPDDAFEKVLRVNVQSNHWLAHMVLPEMVERKDGVVILVSSIAGLKGRPMIGAYAISKAADVQLVRNLACEYGPDNIRVNAISPGLVRTDFARALWENPDTLAARTAGDPLRRIGEPEEIAGCAVFLASAAGNFTTGQNFVIDGGATIAS
jgi:NAD(P)-dependent dehydrogenase (short-subunit alcohol dehydrogenase family)